MTDPPREATVGIVGAGITGLALTHYLAERDIDTLTLEASPEPGGVIRSVEREGTVLELGPQRFRLTDGIVELATAAGVRDAVVTADEDLPLYVYAGGRLRRVPLSLGGIVRTDLLSWRGKLRALAEPFTDGIQPDETAAAAFKRKFGTEVYTNLIGPLYGGTYGSDPAAMPAEHALKPLMRLEEREGSLLRPALKRVLSDSETPPPVTFERGNQQLATALAAKYSDRLELGTPVDHVRPDGDGYLLETGRGPVRVAEVIMTVPAAAAADLLSEVAPAVVEGLANLTYNTLAYVFLQSGVNARGLGYQVRRSEPLRTLGVTWNASAFDRDNLYTAFLGGMEDPEVLTKDEETIGRIAAEEFETVMGEPAESILVNVVEDAIPAYDDTWDGIADLETQVPEGMTFATNYTARVGVPGRVREAKRIADRMAKRVDGTPGGRTEPEPADAPDGT